MGKNAAVALESFARQTSRMFFQPFYRFDTGCAAYVFGCVASEAFAVVDARLEDVDKYVAFAESKGCKILFAIDTHVHADHRSGGPEIAKRTGAAYCLHEAAEVNHPVRRLKDGEELHVGKTLVRVLHTPGHTAESICLLVIDPPRGPEPWFVLTGDTLFVGAVGRPDLPGQTEKNANVLFDSVHAKLLSLPDGVEIYPAHFSGAACAKGMSGKPMSTIGSEKRWNKVLSVDRPSFIAQVSNVPAQPAEMDANIRFNRGAK
jgi:glyoxylase-like metal-dependent hydrolase (beta-lactamase superfamily II)